MTKYCKVCGCQLQETNLGNYWCPNCFDYRNVEEEKIVEESDKSYIG